MTCEWNIYQSKKEAWGRKEWKKEWKKKSTIPLWWVRIAGYSSVVTQHSQLSAGRYQPPSLLSYRQHCAGSPVAVWYMPEGGYWARTAGPAQGLGMEPREGFLWDGCERVAHLTLSIVCVQKPDQNTKTCQEQSDMMQRFTDEINLFKQHNHFKF